MQILLEALTVGISALLMGLLLHVILGYHALHSSSPNMKEEMIRLSILLFLTGFSIHLVYEYLGLNKWYCKYGNASK